MEKKETDDIPPPQPPPCPDYEEETEHDSDLEVEGEDYSQLKFAPTRIMIEPRHLKQGHDFQGIPWKLFPISRPMFRIQRLKFKSYSQMFGSSPISITDDIKSINSSNQFYSFRSCCLKERPIISHFQLSNLVWAPTISDLYYLRDGGVCHYNTISRKSKTIIPLSSLSFTQISSMTAKDNILALGGLTGELAIKDLNKPDLVFESHSVAEDNCIMNAIEIIENQSGATQMMLSNNDKTVKFLDLQTFEIPKTFNFDFAVNQCQLSPDRKLLCVIGDTTTDFIVDSSSGEVLNELTGHQDYSFTCCWSPDNRYVATGNQDKTLRLYDTRDFTKPLHVFEAKNSTFRATKFTDDGRYLCASEDIDYVHIFDAQNFNNSQVIDYFGITTGISFAPNGTLYIGISDKYFGSIMEWDPNDLCLGDLIL